MADAAHWILAQPSRECTARFFVDEQVLRDNGVTDFDAYRSDPDTEPELDDFIDRPGAAGPSGQVRIAR